MSLIQSFKHWIGVGEPVASSESCPQESEILKYKEGGLSSDTRRRLEGHFANCADCQELFVLIARFPEEEVSGSTTPSSAEIQQQTARILHYIEEDENRHSDAAGNDPVRPVESGWTYQNRAWLTAATAFAVILLASGGYLWISRDGAAAQAANSLALSVEKERPGLARMSGGYHYAPFGSTRGAEDPADVNLRLAKAQSSGGDDPGASAELRRIRARVLLATNDNEKAESILKELIAAGVKDAEVYNDLGVAQYQTQKFEDAIASFSQALEKKSGYGEALFNRALAREASRRNTEAQSDWQQFINMTTDAQWKEEANRHLQALLNPAR